MIADIRLSFRNSYYLFNRSVCLLQIEIAAAEQTTYTPCDDCFHKKKKNYRDELGSCYNRPFPNYNLITSIRNSELHFEFFFCSIKSENDLNSENT